MTKSTVTRVWIAGLIALAAGLVMGGLGLGLMLAFAGHYTPAPGGNGYDFVPTMDGLFWATLGLMIAGFTVAAAGGAVDLAAWIGALVNTAQLEDKTWFAVLLVGGVLGFAFGVLGFAAMLAYVVAGPDGTTAAQPRLPTPAPRPAPLVEAG